MFNIKYTIECRELNSDEFKLATTSFAPTNQSGDGKTPAGLDSFQNCPTARIIEATPACEGSVQTGHADAEI